MKTSQTGFRYKCPPTASNFARSMDRKTSNLRSRTGRLPSQDRIVCGCVSQARRNCQPAGARVAAASSPGDAYDKARFACRLQGAPSVVKSVIILSNWGHSTQFTLECAAITLVIAQKILPGGSHTKRIVHAKKNGAGSIVEFLFNGKCSSACGYPARKAVFRLPPMQFYHQSMQNQNPIAVEIFARILCSAEYQTLRLTKRHSIPEWHIVKIPWFRLINQINSPSIHQI